MAIITTILSTDVISTSRTTINTNFTNLNSDKIETSYLDTDTALAANSDTKIASQRAVKTYIDTSGGANASETARGIVEEATDAEVTAGTATGATGAKLFISVAKLRTFYPAGIISPYAGSAAPSGYLLCDGATVSQATYAALYAVTAHTFGADPGGGNFILPNLKGRIPVGLDSAQAEFDVRGETGGAKTHTLTEAEMPAHTHTTPFVEGGSTGAGKLMGAPTAQPSNGTSTSNSTGGGGAHNNLQPYIALNYIIKF